MKNRESENLAASERLVSVLKARKKKKKMEKQITCKRLDLKGKR